MGTPKRFSVKRLIVGIIILGVIGVVAWRIVQASAPSEPSPDVEQIRARTGIPVEVARVERAPLEVRRTFTGPVRGIRSATVRARTGDEIVEIPVRVGDRVTVGQMVLRQSAQGSMASVNQAEAAFEQSRRTVDRLRPLHEKGAVSDQDFDNALTALRVAEANLEAAQRSVVLTSPVAGVVTDIPSTVGSVPAPGDPLVHVSDLSRVQVIFQVSTGQRQELALGQRVILPGAHQDSSASAEAGAGRPWAGEVTRIAMQADLESRLMEVEATFQGPGPSGASPSPEGGPLIPGSLATVEVVVGTRDEALLIPQVAFRNGGVWVVDVAGAARFREVEVGLQSATQTEILGGLQEGDRVVVAGASLLSEGVQTRIVGG